jgi:hypothetical protein
MAFDVIAAYKFLKADGTEAKPPYERSWLGIEKVHVVEQLERGLMRAMLKMNSISGDIGRGKAPESTVTNPVELVLTATVLEDGVKWAKVTFEWPKMGEEQQALMIGIVDGELSASSETDVQRAEVRKGKKDDKPGGGQPPKK